jgi:hypothetical protein
MCLEYQSALLYTMSNKGGKKIRPKLQCVISRSYHISDFELTLLKSPTKWLDAFESTSSKSRNEDTLLGATTILDHVNVLGEKSDHGFKNTTNPNNVTKQDKNRNSSGSVAMAEVVVGRFTLSMLK